MSLWPFPVAKNHRFYYYLPEPRVSAPGYAHNPKFPNRIQASTHTLAGACQ